MASMCQQSTQMTMSSSMLPGALKAAYQRKGEASFLEHPVVTFAPGTAVFVHGWTTAAIKPTIITVAITGFATDVVLWIVAMLRRIMTTRS